MRIPYPERISYPAATFFALGLVAVQLLEHTDLLFSGCCFAFILVSTAAFNIGGGLYRPVGAYVFFNAVLTFILGIMVKAGVGEAAQTNLTEPDRFVQIYLLGMVSTLVAAYIESRFRSQRPVLSTKLAMPSLGGAYKGAVVIGLGLTIFFMLPLDLSQLAVLRTIENTNLFLPFSIILGTIYTVRSSNGRKSTTPGLIMLMVVLTMQGLLSFSKQALYTPAFCWVIGAAVARYKLRPVNLVMLAVIVYLAFSYGNAYSEYGRNFKSLTGGDWANAPVAYELLSHPNVMKANYEATGETAFEASHRLEYYNQPMGLFERLQMISIDDALITETDEHGFFGYEPYKEGIENLVPHFLWPNKPVPYFGNTYMHQIGGIDPHDTTTGVSFSITADAYHEGGLFAVLVVQCLSLAIVFLFFSYLLGNVRDNPVVLMIVLLLSHMGPENPFFGVFVMVSLSFVAVAFGFACKYILPVAASVFDPEVDSRTTLRPALAAE